MSVWVRPASRRERWLRASALFEVAFRAVARSHENPSTSMFVRPASLRSGSFSLLAQRKGTKRNGSPAASPCALHARKVRERRPVAPTARPCADGAMSAIPRAPPAGHFGRRPPPLTGTQGQGGALLRAEAGAQAEAGAKTRARAGAVVVLALRRLVRPGWPRCWLHPPFGPGARAKIRPAGAARGSAPSLPSGQGWSVGKPRSASAQSRAHDARVTGAARVPFSLVSFSWASKRKTPDRRDAGRTNMDVSGFSDDRPAGANLIADHASARSQRPRRDAGRIHTDVGGLSYERPTNQKATSNNAKARSPCPPQGCGTNEHGRERVVVRAPDS